MSDAPLVAIISAMAAQGPAQLQQIKAWLFEQRQRETLPSSLVVDHSVVPVPASPVVEGEQIWVEAYAADFLRRNTESYGPDMRAIQSALDEAQGKGLLVRQALGDVKNMLALHKVMRELLYACGNPPAIIAFEVAPKDITAMSFSVEDMVQINPRRLSNSEVKMWLKTTRTQILFSQLRTLMPEPLFRVYRGLNHIVARLSAVLGNK